ncbi:unnamed protein product [Mucor fragilis]
MSRYIRMLKLHPYIAFSEQLSIHSSMWSICHVYSYMTFGVFVIGMLIISIHASIYLMLTPIAIHIHPLNHLSILVYIHPQSNATSSRPLICLSVSFFHYFHHVYSGTHHCIE